MGTISLKFETRNLQHVKPYNCLMFVTGLCNYLHKSTAQENDEELEQD